MVAHSALQRPNCVLETETVGLGQRKPALRIRRVAASHTERTTTDMFRSLRGLRSAAVITPILLIFLGPVDTATAAPSDTTVTAQAAPAAVSETLIMSFAAAASKILDVREKYLPQIKAAPNEGAASKIFTKAQTEMRAILKVENITEDQYNGVVDAARADPALAEKIQTMIDKNKETTKKK
jgi:hypothetical protein